MKIALFGKDTTVLQQERSRLLDCMTRHNDESRGEVTCFHDEQELMANLMDYQMVLVEPMALDILERFMGEGGKPARVTLASNKEVCTFFAHEIYYVEAELSRIKVVLEQECVMLSIPISEAEKVLEPAGFIKIHRSYLVNEAHIKEIKKNTITLDNGMTLPLSKYRLKDVRMRYLEGK